MNNKAFTLVELSIVLLIIALLMGAILTSSSIIETNLTRRIITDLNMFQSATTVFRNQYGYLPGDFPNATNVFTNSTVNNGNGNNIIDANIEQIYTWQHLSLAGMISGNYTGTYSSPNNYVIGLNVPSSRLSNVGYSFDSGNIYGTYKYAIAVAQTSGTSGGFNGPVFTPSFSQKIDNKMDDGNPATGIILGLQGSSTGSVCTSQNYNSAPTGSVNYLSATDNTTSCIIWYVYY